MARRFFEENRSQLPKKPRALRVQDLFLRTRPDSLLSQRALATAKDVRVKVLGGLSFEDAAARFSDDPRGKEGGTLGRFNKGELDPALENAAFALRKGELSQPVETRYGWHILKMVDRDSAGTWVDVKHILIAETPSKVNEDAARERAEAVRADIVSGKIDFVDAIKKYSDDPDAKTRDGDLGWIPIDSFYGDMHAVADTLRVGRISPPVAGDGGFHVFKVLGEQAEGTYTFDEVADQMKQLAGQKAMETQLKSWLEELRKKYPVETKVKW